jgi:cytochrome c biogenesis protein CcmG/thiol:disulfide interchange protein DsbE
MPRPTRKPHRILIAIAVASAALALSACGSDEELDPGNAADAPDYSRLADAAPPALAELYATGGIVVDGGVAGFEEQIAALEGYPIVVNKWASWCGPCRAEFPFLQSQAAERGDEVAFLGINTQDSDDAAETFLRGHPIPYPSFSDPEGDIARSLGAELEFPATVFYDEQGNVAEVHRGVYASEGDLAADIDRYAGAPR